ncbi:unnamed protein product [Linum tenue]|uniref:RING-type E3 ubiquitin transferase n=1 Tax=Linum tenue TaxID=586396 RepID=A0AAV0Q042_9ROSI|nr:unnamed protein product [Linum tenue]
MMREPSMVVRETAAEHVEERQSDWAYSKPVVILDIIWNLAFVAAGVAVLVLSTEERANMPLRLWIVGYGLQCLLHMGCVCVEYRRRRRRRVGFGTVAGGGGNDGSSSSGSRGDSGDYVTLAQLQDDGTRYACFFSCLIWNSFGVILLDVWRFGAEILLLVCWLIVD